MLGEANHEIPVIALKGFGMARGCDFTATPELAWNPGFNKKRNASVGSLDLGSIDAPILDIVERFAEIRCCYTLQSCYGHFMYPGQANPRCTEQLPLMDNDTEVEYRIAYMAFCINGNRAGIELLSRLMNVPVLEPEYIQFGCADWFRRWHPNACILQVEPGRFKELDTAKVSYMEALHIEKTRDMFFAEIRNVLSGLPGD